MRLTSLGSCLMESMRNFLKAIDHMEFHPTLGKEKKGTSFKLRKA